MKLILILINLLLNFFVTVGDFFIFYIQLILTIIKKIVEFLEKFYTNTYKNIIQTRNPSKKYLVFKSMFLGIG